MSVSWIAVSILLVGLVGYLLSRARARAIEARGTKMHSRPHYYGWWTALLSVIPSLVFLFLWTVGSSVYIEHRISAEIPVADASDASHDHSLMFAMVRSISDGLPRLDGDLADYNNLTYAQIREKLGAKGVAVAEQGENYMVPLAINWAQSRINFNYVGEGLALIMAFVGFFIGFSGVGAKKRARNKVERMVQWGLVGASIIAILTTVGIVCSMLFQTISFFQSVPLSNFFFGTVWDPRFSAAGSDGEIGQFGLIPLLAGTLYIAFVAMLFAVPVGLFAAVYMAEYASPRARGIIKPLLEILAGIPTIVYGFFALMTVGPLLRDISIAISGGQGFIMAQSVLTAGLVMGIMLIPFVSSLSDDIITAVPRSLRDGSLGLGATQSETIKKVVVPAALPGIVGALLLTASRAIGETMIVVLAAGVAANLTINPFEAMTTITVKIVHQLMGDLEFNSPQTLVAFALGMTLFMLTLFINIFALYIVRKYREQYE